MFRPLNALMLGDNYQIRNTHAKNSLHVLFHFSTVESMSNPHQLGYQARTVSDTRPPLTPDDENLEAKDATLNSEEKIMGSTQIPEENGNEVSWVSYPKINIADQTGG